MAYCIAWSKHSLLPVKSRNSPLKNSSTAARRRSYSSQFPQLPTQRKPVQAVVAAEAVDSVGTSESALGASLAAGGFGFCRRRAHRRSRNWIARNQPFLRAGLYGATGRRRNAPLLCQSPCRHARSGTRSNIRQSRHYQHGLAIAFRVCAVPRQLLWFTLAVVVGRSGHRLDRTGVLALRLLRLFRLCVLAVCL